MGLKRKDKCMWYWIAYKDGRYISGTDEFGYPIHSKDKKDAWKFYDFKVASSYLEFGYSLLQEYIWHYI